jgi:putative oxidoreductase
MQNLYGVFNLLGRLLIVALFLPAGLSKLTGFESTVGYFDSLGIPLATLAVVVTIVIEVVGSIALLLGFQTRLAAVVLAVFTLAATMIGHAYWAAPADQAFVQQLMFFKNIAVVGGLFALVAAGAGSLSIDGRKASVR